MISIDIEINNYYSQDGQKTKSPNAKIDLSKSNKNKSLHSVRTRPKEDVSAINFKTEPSEDQMTLSVALERTEKRKDNVEIQKVTPKSSSYQPLNIKRKTTTFKERAVVF